MAAQDSLATGADSQADGMRKRNVAQTQPNGNYVPKEVGDKMGEKSKEKVCHEYTSP